MLKETFISRKKLARIPMRAKDHAGWRHNGSSMPEKVIRSPENPDKWLTVQEYVSLIASLEADGAPFRSPKGRKLVFRPYREGEFAWFSRPDRISRERCAFIEGMWIPAPKKKKESITVALVSETPDEDHVIDLYG